MEKPAVVNITYYTLVWYTFYDPQSGNGVAPILTAPQPTWGTTTKQWEPYRG